MSADTSGRLVDLLDLTGGVAVVAGGGGAIGQAICVRLVECGATVYCLDRPGVPAPHAAAVASAFAQIDRSGGRLDIVIHAAGITRDARMWKMSADDWNLVLSTNLTSAFHLLHAAVPIMRRGSTPLTTGRAIVLISSINGERGKVGQSSYAASKAGLNALARTAARELGAFGIRVNAIAPGWIETPMTAGVPEEARQRALAESPLGHFGKPDDGTRAVVFLAGGLGRHITGQGLRVDGGQLIG